VTRGLKGTGVVELTEGGGEWHGGAKTVWRQQSGRLARTQSRGREEGGDGVLGRALTREEERKIKRGVLYRRRGGE
jgi:hypothetical protein